MITVNIRYRGEKDAAVRFAEEMKASGIVDEIKREEGNIRYEYFLPLDGEGYVLLIDAWRDQAALNKHHSLPLMKRIAELREKYDLHMDVEKFISLGSDEKDYEFIRK